MKSSWTYSSGFFHELICIKLTLNLNAETWHLMWFKIHRGFHSFNISNNNHVLLYSTHWVIRLCPSIPRNDLRIMWNVNRLTGLRGKEKLNLSCSVRWHTKLQSFTRDCVSPPSALASAEWLKKLWERKVRLSMYDWMNRSLRRRPCY